MRSFDKAYVFVLAILPLTIVACGPPPLERHVNQRFENPISIEDCQRRCSKLAPRDFYIVRGVLTASPDNATRVVLAENSDQAESGLVIPMDTTFGDGRDQFKSACIGQDAELTVGMVADDETGDSYSLRIVSVYTPRIGGDQLGIGSTPCAGEDIERKNRVPLRFIKL